MNGMPDKSRPTLMKTSTANPEEIARFASLAEQWWDPDGEFRPLHQLNPTRLAYMRNRLCAHFNRSLETVRPLEGLTLVDIGCGGGLLTEPMCRLGAKVTGIDAGAETINAARHHANATGLKIDYRQILPEDIHQERRVFDIVLNMEVIEHVADRELFIETTAKLVKPGGAMVLSSLNRTLKSLALAKIFAEYILKWLPVGTHDWRQFVRPSEIINNLRFFDMEVCDISGLSYHPLERRWRESHDLAVNFIMLAIKNKVDNKADPLTVKRP